MLHTKLVRSYECVFGKHIECFMKYYLYPIDEVTNLLSILYRHSIVIMSGVQPVDHDHIGIFLSVIQSSYQFGHPALKQPTHLADAKLHIN